MAQRISNLGYALLGLLARESLSGYDLARKMRDPIGFFWHAGHSQIYPELARLERDGLVSHRVVAQRDRPDKKVYAATPAGREALRAWVTAPLEIPSVRDELVLRAFSLWVADPRRAAALFREHERRHRDRLAYYQAVGARLWGGRDRPPAPDSPLFGDFVTLERGIRFEQENVAWCAWVAEQLEAAARSGGRAPEGDREPEPERLTLPE